MDGLFFGQKYSLRNQNLTRALDKVIATPEHFVRVVVHPTGLYSTLGVDILASRDSSVTLATTRAEFRREVEREFVAHFGAEPWSAIARALTKPPGWTCIRATGGDQEVERVMQELRDLTQHQYAISQLPSLGDCIRLDFAHRDTELVSEARVIVDTGCGEAVLRGADVFAPGVKGCTAGLLAGVVVEVWIDLDNALMRGDKDSGPSARRRLLYIGLGRTAQPRSEMFHEARKGVAVHMLHRPTGDSPALHSLLDGKIFLQNLPSALVCHALGPQPGELVLDMCASPGGKTSHVAAMMRNQGVLVACDRTVNKVLPVLECCNKFALHRGHATNQGFLFCCRTDSSKACSGSNSTAGKADYSLRSGEERRGALLACLASQPVQEQGVVMLNGGGLPLGVFDRVLLDGPCSSLGLRPRFSHIAMTNSALEEMSVVQRRMLFNAVMLVKVGGSISYSTCTFNPGENEQVVRWALDLFGSVLRLVPVLPRLGQPGLRSILSEEEAGLVQRFDPSDMTVDSIGFFVAKFEKLADSSDVARAWV